MNGQLRQVQREEMDEDAQAIRAARRAQMFVVRMERYQNLSKDARTLLDKMRREKIRSGYRLYRPPMDTDEIDRLTTLLKELIATQFIRFDRDTWDIELVEEDIEDEEEEDDQDQGSLDLAERTRGGGQEIEDEEDDEDDQDPGSIDLAASVERTRGRRHESISSSNSADFSYMEPGTPTQPPGFVTIDGQEEDKDGDENDHDGNRVLIAPHGLPPPQLPRQEVHDDNEDGDGDGAEDQPPAAPQQRAAAAPAGGKKDHICRITICTEKHDRGAKQERDRHEKTKHGLACKMPKEAFLAIVKPRIQELQGDEIFVHEEFRGQKRNDFADDTGRLWSFFALCGPSTEQVEEKIDELNQALRGENRITFLSSKTGERKYTMKKSRERMEKLFPKIG